MQDMVQDMVQDTDTLWQTAIAVLVAILASSGFWAYLMHKDTAKSATTKLMMGLAYDKITYIGMKYIERGWISRTEYEDFRKYFYEPYEKLGGNGTAKKIMEEISRMPLKSDPHNKMILAERRMEERDPQ